MGRPRVVAWRNFCNSKEGERVGYWGGGGGMHETRTQGDEKARRDDARFFQPPKKE